jgi:hypothetical protein
VGIWPFEALEGMVEHVKSILKIEITITNFASLAAVWVYSFDIMISKCIHQRKSVG